MNRRIRSTITAAVMVGVLAVPAAASATTPPANVAVGTFSRYLLGVSVFTQPSPDAVTVNGRYAFLRAGRSYFTVIYGNGNCDPAQAFPVGPFVADRNGRATLTTTVPAPKPGLVAGTLSVSVRRGDTAADEDKDGLTGPTDVVAVPGSPSIGLVECNSTPIVP